MLEIEFSDSAAAGLKQARAMNRTAAENQEPAEVACFHIGLSVGDISGEGVDQNRYNTLRQLFSVYPADVAAPAARSLFEGAASSLDHVAQALRTGSRVRIWYSGQPDEWCGFYWITAQIKRWGADSGILAVRSPQNSAGGWSGAPLCAWQRAEGQIAITPARIRGAAAKWQILQGENAPLRAVVQGKLQSVPADFYDGWLEREMKAQGETFHEAQLIGTVLRQCHLGVSDGWLALRLDEWIRQGRLEALTPAPQDGPRYHRLLRKKK